MSNPVEEYLQTKTAGVQGSFSGFGTGVGSRMLQGAMGAVKPEHIGAAVAGTAMVGATAGITAAATKIMGAITKKKEFEAMMEHAPDLRDYHEKSPDLFNRHYNSFRSMNPTFAKDPVVSATYMRNMSEYPESAGKTIVDSLGSVPRNTRGIDLKLGKEGPQISFKG